MAKPTATTAVSNGCRAYTDDELAILERSERNARGWLIAFYIRAPRSSTTERAFDHYAEAAAWLASDDGRVDRFLGASVICGLRFLPGRANAFRDVPEATLPDYAAAILADGPTWGDRFTTSDGVALEWVHDMAGGSGYCEVER